jgi:peptidyl-dipeptidase A
MKKNISVKNMFEISEEFFVSLGLDKLPEEFWKRSIFQRPKEIGREMNCHASAWDFYDGKDFRLVFFNNQPFVTKVLYNRVV